MKTRTLFMLTAIVLLLVIAVFAWNSFQQTSSGAMAEANQWLTQNPPP